VPAATFEDRDVANRPSGGAREYERQQAYDGRKGDECDADRRHAQDAHPPTSLSGKCAARLNSQPVGKAPVAIA